MRAFRPRCAIRAAKRSTGPAASSSRPPRTKRPPRLSNAILWALAGVCHVTGSRLRTLAILGGADGEVLDGVPLETTRFVQMFFVLAGTALVSAVSMLFAIVSGVGAALWVAVPLAIIWFAIIFNLDRFLTSTMSSTRSIAKLIALAIPRVIMAVIIGFVVAEPLVLQIFHNDISQEVATTNIAQAQADQTALDEGPEKLALDAASARVAELENQAATGIVAGTDSTSAGVGAAQSTVDALAAKLAEQQNREVAEAQLPAARESYDAALAAYNARADSVAQGNAGATGLLSQITALNTLSEREPAILWAHWLIAALFFMIELLPVLVKVLTSYGGQTLHEKAAAIRKQVAHDRVTVAGFRDRADIVAAKAAG